MTRAKAVGLSAAFLLSGFGVSYGLIALVALLLWRDRQPGVVEAAALQSAVMLPVFALATWCFGMRTAGLGPDELRWRGGPKRGLQGVLFGAIPAALAMVAAVPLAGAGWSLDGGSFLAWLGSVSAFSVLLLPAALTEEIIFRGVPLVLLGGAIGRPLAVVVTAAAFGLIHLLNPEITPLAVGNVALAGVFLGVVFYLPGGLWTATGAHLGWNLAQTALAAPVSGLPFTIPWLDYHAGAPGWVSGAGFGPEGGIVATITLGITVLIAARYTERDKERYA